ncbi:DMT family transporter [Ruegeria pomeroyi]|uniref:Membrane protein, putative n=2 Tax=Ruegeria pomeroyi TaxID=89184 RepID=Q5LT53_RUEPO|nr:DMT family transporter [Ruegeria pomeroyi]HCE72612.1 EamA/RhaT family transporter [Ruegeria sp.]AAV94848.1 membrane protein, putative [Ruegeria pomeroyi DSS-3]NVK95495.1 DMT family transporter [Ruegeria pomeroyi]NVL02173.1 DMT family transporter [Ruegeria pomeroyi]QWV08422.1 DMT family transporter [Ruegeria pomeroyi]
MSALGLGLIAALCWGLHDITIRYLSRTVPLMGALAVVLATGLGFQATVLAATEGARLPQGPALWLSIGSGLAFLVASLGLYFAFERGPVRLVAPIIGAYPILSLLFAFLAGAPIGADQVLAVLVIVGAVGVVAGLSDDSGDPAPPKGPTIALSMIAAIGFAATFKLGQMAATLDGELNATLLARVTALVLLLALIVIRRQTLRVGAAALLPLVVMGLLDGVALLAVISAGVLDHPQLAAVASSMFGLITIVLAWAFLRESMSRPQWVGCLAAFLAIGYLAW